MSTASWICSKSKAYKLASHGKSNSEQAPRYTVQGCQCEGQGSLDVLREAQMDGMQSCDKEGARLCFKSLALPTQKRLRCCIEHAQMLLENAKLAKGYHTLQKYLLVQATP